MPTVHGNVTQHAPDEEIMEHLTRHGTMPAIIEYIRCDDFDGSIQIKAACGAKVVITPQMEEYYPAHFDIKFC